MNLKRVKKKILDDLEKNKTRRNKTLVEKRKNNPIEALAHNLRSRTAHAFGSRGYTKRSKTYSYLGISFEELKRYIESKFKDGMFWENRKEWHIDHVIPLASANSEEELIALCYYKNLEPIWKEDNLIKSDNYIQEDKEEYLKWYNKEVSPKKINA